MASPQWKAYQATVQDPAILAYQSSTAPVMGSFVAPAINTMANIQNTIGVTNGMCRELGFIEKLLHSYGFIQCCDRESRLFFHFSEYGGDMNTMKIGDMVEFEVSVDKRTRKPIAVSVLRADHEILNEAQVSGTVLSEPKSTSGDPNNPDCLGSLSYEECGEFFFLPFGMDDIEDNKNQIHIGDEVTFFIAKDKRNGNLRGRKVKLKQPAVQQVKETTLYQGVVCSMKESFGFIERADVVKEIFFHYSEYQGNINDLMLGDDVEFLIQDRNGKEVAVNIKQLPQGTVIFEDIAVERRRGRIEKTLKPIHGCRSSDPLAGRIVYETVSGPIEIPFGDKDQKGDYTLQANDLVEFNITTDRRDKLQRATNIELVEATFKVNGESRETGVIATVKDGFGFIRCAERDARMFFHFSEMLNPDKEIKPQEEVAFTVIMDPTDRSRQIAIRIKFLPKGSVSFENILPEKHTGTIEKEPTSCKSPGKNKEPDPGIIMYDVNGTKQTLPYSIRAVTGTVPCYSDKVEFQICESRKNNTKTAVNVRLLAQNSNPKQQGFIATLKESFGFIESADHEREVFFHFSNFEGQTSDLELGDEVEYTLGKKTAKVAAENIRKLPRGTVSPEEVLPGIVEGRVTRCMRIVNPDQDEYPGLVQAGTEVDVQNADSYTYGITSLADKRDFLQKGDVVKFQIAITKNTGKRRATNIQAVRKYSRAKVDSVKGQFGFLLYEVEENKKLFFHMTEVNDNAEIHPGDEVEFVVVQNQRNGKYSACSLRKITDRQRPERLISRLKSVSDDNGPKLIILRQPMGPDGTNGFKQPRPIWQRSA